MKHTLLIKNGNVVLPDKIIKADILIKKEKISSIKKNIEPSEKYKVIEAKNKYILPGGIDVHTHMELEVWEGMVSSDDFYTGSKAGLNGGITSYFGFAYQNKNESLVNAYKRVYKSAEKKSVSNFHLHSGILNTNMEYEKQIKDAVKIRIKTFKLHLNDPNVDTIFLSKIFKLIAQYNAILLLHCEDGKIAEYNKSLCVKSKKFSMKYHPKTRKNFVEKLAIDTVLTLAKEFKTKIYIVHLTTAEGLESIRRAKQEGVWVETETCPQYLLFTDAIYKKKSAYLYSCTPPFRKKYDIKMLWQGLKDGTIKVISSDHCPFTIKQKNTWNNDFTKLPYGIPGIETLYPIILSEGKKHKLTFNQIANLIATNPAKIFGLYPKHGVIQKGSYADIIIYNPAIKYKIKSKDLLTNIDYSPYENLQINGKIEKVIYMGKEVF